MRRPAVFYHPQRADLHTRLRRCKFAAAVDATWRRYVSTGANRLINKRGGRGEGRSLLTTSPDTLHFSLDVTAKGKLPLLLDEDSPSLINNITIFLYSYDTGRNFTISNGTASENDASFGDIMKQEQGSTVKHINWIWPDCLVGDGQPDNEASDRGLYNVSQVPGLMGKREAR